ncbi:PREDICTED: peritrophin-1-like [Papilio xuthus]|uniref:Peritrophin-1-like n=1 Tax=Papilio xuthus TaxID=66420 RepID=A0AAJ6ZCE1_PAPXU|nr:PREDICTED: peritrophin-1-like [Papilio xuthus]
MQFITAVFFLAVAAAGNGFNLCPKIQEIDWNIELLLPHWKCNKFIQCTHGEPVEMSCPDGLYFNVIEGICDWRGNVDCGFRIVPNETKPEEVIPIQSTIKDEEITEDIKETEADTSGEESISEEIQTETPDLPVIEFLPNGCPVDPEVHWLLPHETFCNLFYYCVQGEREVKSCPFWLHFNRELQICDLPRNVECMELRD